MIELNLDDPRWRNLISEDPAAEAFHHPAWAKTVSTPYGFRAFVLARLQGEAVVAGLPLVEVRRPLQAPRWTSLPFTDHCAPLARGTSELKALTRDLETARHEAGIRIVEVRAALPTPASSIRTQAVLHRLPLASSAEETAAAFERSQVLRNVRKAQREGVLVRLASQERDVTETYYGLHAATRRRQGVPVQPRRFFAQIWHGVVASGLGFCLLAEADGKAIAGAVFLTWNQTLTYKFGASDARAWPVRPNNLIFWEAIRLGCEQGRTVLDFGRSEAENQGLRQFKASWGASESRLKYSCLGVASASRRGRLAKVAEPVIRRSPIVVCRLAGELFYRFAA
jgi:CelD/BcsL family acetyltransferase involved in cellulose biosynthesis